MSIQQSHLRIPNQSSRRFSWFLVTTFLLLSPSNSSARSLEYADIDLATVRLLAVKGIHIQEIPVNGTGQRSVAIPNVSHGSGIVVSEDGLIITAHHVIEGALTLAVKIPEKEEAIPAKVLYSDEERDFAILSTATKMDHYLPISSTPKKMRMREPVHAIGYPIDARLPYPLSSPGIIAGELPDGFIQLGMSLNPGNSGGPVIDMDNQLIAIVVARGDPSQGVLGLGLAIPIHPVVAVMHQVVMLGQNGPLVKWTAREKRLAAIAATLVETGPAGMLREVSKLLRERNTSTLTDFQLQAMAGDNTNFSVLTAAFLWDAVVMLTEDAGHEKGSHKRNRHKKANNYLQQAIELCHAAVKRDPDITLQSTFVMFIVGQWPEPTSGMTLDSTTDQEESFLEIIREGGPSSFQKPEEDVFQNSIYNLSELTQ